MIETDVDFLESSSRWVEPNFFYWRYIRALIDYILELVQEHSSIIQKHRRLYGRLFHKEEVQPIVFVFWSTDVSTMCK